MRFEDAFTPDSVNSTYPDSVANSLLIKELSTDGCWHPQSSEGARRIRHHHSTIIRQIMDNSLPQWAPVNPLTSTNPDKEVN